MVEYVALANLKGPQGDVTPAALDALADAREARDDAQTARTGAEAARDAAETFAGQAEGLQDEAVSGLLGDPESATGAGARALISDRAFLMSASAKGASELFAPLREAVNSNYLSTYRIVTAGSSTWGERIGRGFDMVSRLAFRASGTGPVPIDDASPAAPGVQVIMASHGGNSANWMPSARIAQVKGIAPNMLIIGVGSNDWAEQRDPVTVEQNVDAVVSQIEDGNPGLVTVIVWQQRRYDLPDDRVYKWDQYGAALRRVADAGARRVFFDAGLILNGMMTNASPQKFGLLHPDLIHLSQSGNLQFANALCRFLGVPVEDQLVETRRAQLDRGGDLNPSNAVELFAASLPAVSYPRWLDFECTIFYRKTGGRADLILSAPGGYVQQAIPDGENTTWSAKLRLAIPPGGAVPVSVVTASTEVTSMYVSTNLAYSNVVLSTHAI